MPSRWSATISADGLYRYELARDLGPDAGLLRFVYVGVNPSTADAEKEDATTRRWNWFTLRNWGACYTVVNAFAFRATDVKTLAFVEDPVGPHNDWHLDMVMAEADVLVPCWGSAAKLPARLRPRLERVMAMVKRYDAWGKMTAMTFGLTADGQPKHPLMLAKETELIRL